jgi:hypothetical protein
MVLLVAPGARPAAEARPTTETSTLPFGDVRLLTVNVNRADVAESLGEDESVAFTLKMRDPTAVGFPPIFPDAAFSVRPVGSDPAATDQVYGFVPPVAASVTE